jgi:predicted house-cleaning noncanonical NTP pyrophosphatase (MazG superfamily)
MGCPPRRYDGLVPRYDKLIRDGISERLRQKGVSHKTRTLSPAEFAVALRSKLDEEIAEYDAAQDPDDRLSELADLVEVVYALARLDGHEPSDVEARRHRKAGDDGGFEGRLFLVETE